MSVLLFGKVDILNDLTKVFDGIIEQKWYTLDKKLHYIMFLVCQADNIIFNQHFAVMGFLSSMRVIEQTMFKGLRHDMVSKTDKGFCCRS